MKQNHLLQWIEAAEARSVCVLAEEDPTRATIMPVMANVRPFDLGNLRKHYLGDAGKRLSRNPFCELPRPHAVALSSIASVFRVVAGCQRRSATRTR